MDKGHPKGLYLLFATEMAERFSYYGMRALFTLYLVAAFFDKNMSSQIYGSYTGLVYLTPLLGGYIADKYWGNRKSIIVGGLIMAVGQFLMFASACFAKQAIFSEEDALKGIISPDIDNGLSTFLLFAGLAFLIFGNGFFKPNISTMVGDLYEPTDSRKDSAFTIFYMGINIGAFVAPLICGSFHNENGWLDPSSFKWGFMIAGIAMVLSILIFVTLKDKFLKTPEGLQIGLPPSQSELRYQKDAEAKQKAGKADEPEIPNSPVRLWGCIGVALVIFLVLAFNWNSFNWGGFLSLNWESVDWEKFWQGPNDLITAAIYALSIALPVFIITDKGLTRDEKSRISVIYIIAVFVIFFWSAFEQAGSSLTIFADQQVDRIIENVVIVIGDYKINLLLFGLIAIVTIACIFVLIKKFKSLNLIFKILLSGVISICGVLLLIDLLLIITNWDNLVMDSWKMPTTWFQSINPIVVVSFAPVMAALWSFLNKRNMEPFSPAKQAIGLVLLALGYVVIAVATNGVSGDTKVSMWWLVALYFIHTIGELSLSPIGLSMVNKLSPARLASLLMGVWFMSNAAANIFSGKLATLLPGADGEAQSFLGFQITNLTEFFTVFAVMAGVAAIALFALCPTLKKMMKGIQ